MDNKTIQEFVDMLVRTRQKEIDEYVKDKIVGILIKNSLAVAINEVLEKNGGTDTIFETITAKEASNIGHILEEIEQIKIDRNDSESFEEPILLIGKIHKIDDFLAEKMKEKKCQ